MGLEQRSMFRRNQWRFEVQERAKVEHPFLVIKRHLMGMGELRG